jgi:response regulator RpfG family c-di-GMP phosphodiesterase
MTKRDNRLAVLYVDGEAQSHRAFLRACQEQFRVLMAADSLEALDRLKEHVAEIGVVVAARCMPKAKGTWLLQRVRECHPQVVRLLASDGCSQYAEKTALQEGTAEGIISIPWDPPELRKRLHIELERFAARQHEGSAEAKEAPSA